MDKPPDHVKFQMDTKLDQLIQDKGRKSIVCKNLKHALHILPGIESAMARFRRIVGSSPDQGQLDMLVWTVVDPETKMELTCDMMDHLQSWVDGKIVDNYYIQICRTIKNR